jgi:glycosyltransferase involved in cell wall biosynthesis
MPVRIGIPVVVTLHDATFFSDPQHHTAVKAAFFRSATRFALRRAAHTIVPSEATRDELVRILSVDPSRIEVAPHGVDTALFHPPSPAEIERARARLGVTGEYIGFLGTLEPRKNAPSLIRGWIDAVKDRPAPPALVLAGAAGWDRAVDAAAAEVPERLTLLRPGYVDADDLAGFLGGALVVAYPSHGEGFGLPVLEAMACGAPVLTTKLLSLPEVGGDAVAYTDPSPVAIGEALAELLEDPARRSQLAAAGLERSRQFTWTASAQRHRDIYARVQRSR